MKLSIKYQLKNGEEITGTIECSNDYSVIDEVMKLLNDDCVVKRIEEV